MSESRKSFADLDGRFMYRIPGRDYRTEITHKLPSEMTRAERRLVSRDIRRNPDRYFRSPRLSIESIHDIPR